MEQDVPLRIWLFYLLPTLGCAAVLLGVAVLARRSRVPVVAVTIVASVVFGIAWQWHWGGPYGNGDFMNLVPGLVGQEIWSAVSKHFYPTNPVGPEDWYPHMPWGIGLRQINVAVSGVFWALVGLLAGMWVRGRAQR
jgi:hypothetical protein